MMVEGYTPISANRSLTIRRSTPPSSTPTHPPHQHHHHRRHTEDAIPTALPCPTFYDRHPEKVGCIGNVVITEKTELQSWLLIARPVTREEAKARGGCIMFNPSLKGSNTHITKSLYYCLTDTDDEVYGRAAYLPRCDAARIAGKTDTCAHTSDADSSCDSCTAEVLSEPDSPLRSVTPRLASSNSCCCCCVYKHEPVLSG